MLAWGRSPLVAGVDSLEPRYVSASVPRPTVD
jgi:hypothetical protein